MIWLGIETSCDETAVALVRSTESGVEILGSLVSSQIARHRPFGGVVPELAVREHLHHLPVMVPRLLEEAGLSLPQLDGIAVTEGPGLAACLLVGHSYARGLALALHRPVYGINHLEGHLLSPFLSLSGPLPFPFTGLIVSGGNTLLVEAKGWGEYFKRGGTVDDAAGEVFDKVARLLGLAYPGGPEIERMAREGGGDPRAFEFPQSFPERDNFNFSFSGLKTSVRYFLEKRPEQKSDPKFIADVCASFQEAVVQVLVRKAVLAVQASRCRALSAAGGVLCNGRLREELVKACAKAHTPVHIAAGALCTDNAAMIAAVAALKAREGIAMNLGNDISPNMCF